MSWRSVGINNADLIRQLADYKIITKKIVKEAMTATDRKHYCPTRPYIDAPQSIGYDVTISAPHMHAYAFELLIDQIKPGSRVLDVGSGSGYLTACFARAIKIKENATNASTNNTTMSEKGIVIGIEHQPELVKLSRQNIRQDDKNLLDSGDIVIIEGDGRRGYPEKAPYDAIHVGAASPYTPHELINQLKPGGRLICPVGRDYEMQYLEQYDKDASGEIHTKRIMGVVFVPLTDLKKT